MSIVSDVFKVGIGPSSSHTVGPMKAACAYLQDCFTTIDARHISRIVIELYGSLALTGLGHYTDKAILLGLLGEAPDTVAIENIKSYLTTIKQHKTITLLGKYPIDFDMDHDLIYYFKESLPEHANGMIFSVFDTESNRLHTETYFSIGGGIIHTKAQYLAQHTKKSTNSSAPVTPHQLSKITFADAKTLLALCDKHQCSISQLMWKIAEQDDEIETTQTYLSTVWQAMQQCVSNGIHATQPLLPGGLNVQRRAPLLYQQLQAKSTRIPDDPMILFDWLSVYAIAVNEENAAGNRVVTAPTNGSAGVIPALMHYLKQFHPQEFSHTKAMDFLITATAIGHLYQKGASISAAEMGCQGEIGVSCSMGAAAVCEFLGGSVQQVANAAEIGMEHHLGLTCDPIDGLVQIPCIERNTMGAVKAINAARLSLTREKQKITLDEVIQTMFATGKDMSSKYKETAQGGLAIHYQGTDYTQSSRPTKTYDITQNQVAC